MTEAQPNLGDDNTKDFHDNDGIDPKVDDPKDEQASDSSGASPTRDAGDEAIPTRDDGDEEGDNADDNDENEEEDGDDDDDDDDDEEEEDEEPKLKYARLTQHMSAVYRNGDATSAFLVAGDKMIAATHNGNIVRGHKSNRDHQC